jgi:hypothetical protein
VYHCALKIPKIFLNIFLQGKTLPLYTAFYEAWKGRGAFMQARFSVARGSWRWGCAEEWLGLGEPVRLAYARCKQAQKTLSFYTQGYPNITYDRNSFFKKACRRSLFTCKDTKTLQGKRRRVKTNITEMEAVRLKSSSVGLRSKVSAVTKYVYLV